MQETSERVAAVVVLFEPDERAAASIATWVEQVARVYAIDNSTAPDAASVAAFGDRVVYVPFGENRGIAAALNEGARRAAEDGFAWVLTMDQDSEAAPGMVEALSACVSGDPSDVGLVSPAHRQPGVDQPAAAPGCRPVLRAMTSGDLVSLAAWERVGGWREELFIDTVDDEFCVRLNDAGLAVLLSGDVELAHPVGDTRPRMSGRFHTTGHAPIRRYYMTRNRLTLVREHGRRHPELRVLRSEVLKDVVKVALFEEDRLEKLRMMYRGYRDFRRGKLGRYGR